MENNEKKNDINISFKELVTDWSLLLISLLIQIPLFLVLRSVIPSLNWPLYTDEILLFFILLGIIILLVRAFRKVVYVLLIFMFLSMIYGMVFNNLKIKDIFNNYGELLKEIKDRQGDASKIVMYHLTPDYSDTLDFINRKTKVTPLIERYVKRKWGYTNNQSSNGVNDSILRIRDYKLAFSMFKDIKRNWVYLKDINATHYRASDVIEDLSGDVDDFTIVMLSLLKSIGGDVAILYKNTNDIHPLLLIGDKTNEDVVMDIISEMFTKEIKKKDIKFIKDSGGELWLPLSFYQDYPGGIVPNYENYKMKKIK